MKAQVNGTLAPVSLAAGAGMLLPAIQKDGQATIQLLQTDDRGKSQVATLTLTAVTTDAAGGQPHMSVFGQALVGTP